MAENKKLVSSRNDFANGAFGRLWSISSWYPNPADCSERPLISEGGVVMLKRCLTYALLVGLCAWWSETPGQTARAEESPATNRSHHKASRDGASHAKHQHRKHDRQASHNPRGHDKSRHAAHQRARRGGERCAQCECRKCQGRRHHHGSMPRCGFAPHSRHPGYGRTAFAPRFHARFSGGSPWANRPGFGGNWAMRKPGDRPWGPPSAGTWPTKPCRWTPGSHAGGTGSVLQATGHQRRWIG